MFLVECGDHLTILNIFEQWKDMWKGQGGVLVTADVEELAESSAVNLSPQDDG